MEVQREETKRMNTIRKNSTNTLPPDQERETHPLNDADEQQPSYSHPSAPTQARASPSHTKTQRRRSKIATTATPSTKIHGSDPSLVVAKRRHHVVSKVAKPPLQCSRVKIRRRRRLSHQTQPLADGYWSHRSSCQQRWGDVVGSPPTERTTLVG